MQRVSFLSVLALFVTFLPVNTANSLSITKGPYLQNVTPNSIVIMWETDSPSDSLAIAMDTAIIDEQAHENIIYDQKHIDNDNYVTIHEVELNIPYPDYNYLYKVTSSNNENTVTDGTGKFKTAPSSAVDFSFSVISDTHVFDESILPTIVSSMMQDNPDFILHAGDIEPYGDTLGDLQFFFNKIFPLIHNKPIFPVRGNHDIEYPTDWFKDYFSLPNNEQWYTFTYGDVQFFALDSNTVSLEQDSWLENELSSSTAAWKIVFFHKPPYTAGEHLDNEYVKANWVLLFQKYGVNLVLSGHTHGYERYYDDTYDITYIVAGGGTSHLNEDWPNEERTPPPILEKLVKEVSHYLTIDITSETLTLNARNLDGESFDSIIITKSPESPIVLKSIYNATSENTMYVTATVNAGINTITPLKML